MDLKKQLMLVSKALKANFTLNGKSITPQEVFSEMGLLPAMARRADQLCSLCLGYGIGISFEDSESTTLGVKVSFDDITPNVLRLLMLTDVICELVQTAPSLDVTPLDELLYD